MLDDWRRLTADPWYYLIIDFDIEKNQIRLFKFIGAIDEADELITQDLNSVLNGFETTYVMPSESAIFWKHFS